MRLCTNEFCINEALYMCALYKKVYMREGRVINTMSSWFILNIILNITADCNLLRGPLNWGFPDHSKIVLVPKSPPSLYERLHNVN